ncbi:MAG TPA: ABC transporter substrate-binding protein, partial [Chloroflexota bacterium]|nr:ABC transporter substrate-binding protein [Chloroflexota bacterium]
LEGSGIELVTTERYGRNDTNVTPQTLKVVARQPDAVLIWGVVRDSALAVQALKERNYEGQIYVSHGVGNPSFLELAGDAANGVRLPIGPMIVVDELAEDNPIKAVASQYAQDYEAMFGEGTASTFGGHAWDAVPLLKLAIEKAAADGVDFSDLEASRAAIRDALEVVGPYTGVGGVFQYSADDHLGLDDRALVLVEIVDNTWTLAK